MKSPAKYEVWYDTYGSYSVIRVYPGIYLRYGKVHTVFVRYRYIRYGYVINRCETQDGPAYCGGFPTVAFVAAAAAAIFLLSFPRLHPFRTTFPLWGLITWK